MFLIYRAIFHYLLSEIFLRKALIKMAVPSFHQQPSLEESAAFFVFVVHLLFAAVLIVYALFTLKVYLIPISGFVVCPIRLWRRVDFWFPICYDIGGIFLILGVAMMQAGVPGYSYEEGAIAAFIGFSIMMIVSMCQLFRRRYDIYLWLRDRWYGIRR